MSDTVASPNHPWRRPSAAAALLLATWLASLALVFVYSAFVPQSHQVPAEIEQELRPIQDRLRDKGSISADDMKKLGEIAKRGEDAARAKMGREGAGAMLEDMRQHALWLTWVPWMLLAVWLRPRVWEVLVVGAGILGLLLLGLLNNAETAIYSGVVLLTLAMKYLHSRTTVANAP